MFTGIIEETGEIVAVEKLKNGLRLTVAAMEILADLKVDESVNIDGACQTVVRTDSKTFTVEAVGETLSKTTLGTFQVGRKVNLERAMSLNTRLGGHLLQGHVNGTGRITKWQKRGENYYLGIGIPEDLSRYCIPEGSIAVDGISFTIADINGEKIGISIIPHTVKKTTLTAKKIGDEVNIETDLISRIVERLLNKKSGSGITKEKLMEWGY